ncbi:MAG: translation initiation factor IF-5A [Thermoplasmata archaeon]|nr:translation initiation factor IF-5A [Candidatus Sysuiplasma acidicola]MBX8636784.1 translation initiation factor IF-5A [Candidatus Sysuiplasma acidicola]MBX8645506.1 translation initiation factor IF-5A [Candidatus Sysuiplasma acidicola]MDH2904907.1 translation initiation factor IF-5A [Methanomassiliicoccales archaeon]
MAWQQAEVRELKEGRYLLIDDQPCKILSITTSKPGKHGEAKARIDAVGVFDGQKRSLVHPVKHKIQIPQMDKRKAQVLSTSGEEVQLMDLETFETFHLKVDEELRKKLVAGSETLYVSSMGMRKIFEL